MIAAEDVAFAEQLGELLPGMLQRRDGLVHLSRETQHQVSRSPTFCCLAVLSSSPARKWVHCLHAWRGLTRSQGSQRDFDCLVPAHIFGSGWLPSLPIGECMRLIVQVTAVCAWLGEPSDTDPAGVILNLWQFVHSFDRVQRRLVRPE